MSFKVLDQVRWGMIGCGKVTEVKSGPALRKAAGSRVVAVACRHPEKARDYAARHGIPKAPATPEEVILDPEVNAVYVATPPGARVEYVRMAAAAGKAIYAEKPLGATYAECLEMIAICEKAGVPLFVAYYRRALPYFAKIRELLTSGAIGAPRVVRWRLTKPASPADADRENPPWRLQRHLAGEGYLYDVGSHQLDLLDYWFGPIATVRGVATNLAGLYEVADTVCGSFVFSSGVVGSATWHFAAPKCSYRDAAEIIGATGEIRFSFFKPDPIVLETAEGVKTFDVPYPEHVQQPLVQTLVDELRGLGGRCPSRGDTAARTNWAMEELRIKN